MDLAVKALVPWFGGDRGGAVDLVREFGPHSAFWTLFCGGAPEVLAKDPATHETMNDLHGDLVNLAMVLASDRWIELHCRLRRTLHTEQTFAWAKSIIMAEPPDPAPSPDAVEHRHVRRAYLYWIYAWFGINGVAGTRNDNHNFALRYTPGGGGGGRRIASAADSVPAMAERLRSVTISRRDGIELASKIKDVAGVVIYADPPFIEKGAAYQHDFDGRPCCLVGSRLVIDGGHVRLAEALRRFNNARVIVRYYDHPALSELYPGWTKRHRAKRKAMVNAAQQTRERVAAPEVLLINGPSFVESTSLFGVGGDG